LPAELNLLKDRWVGDGKLVVVLSCVS